MDGKRWFFWSNTAVCLFQEFADFHNLKTAQDRSTKAAAASHMTKPKEDVAPMTMVTIRLQYCFLMVGILIFVEMARALRDYFLHPQTTLF